MPVAQQGFPRPYALSSLARGRSPYCTDVQQVLYSDKSVDFCMQPKFSKSTKLSTKSLTQLNDHPIVGSFSAWSIVNEI